MTRMCCVCNKVEQDGQWQTVCKLSEAEPVTHGYCPDCYIEVMAEIEEFIGEKAMCAPRAAGWPSLYGSCRPCA